MSASRWRRWRRKATSCGPGSCGPGCGWECCCFGWRKAYSPTAQSHNSCRLSVVREAGYLSSLTTDNRQLLGRRSMSATQTELRPVFRQRFRTVTRQIWSLHVGHGVAWTIVVVTLLLAASAAADYLFELSWPVRAGLLAVCTAI